MPDYPEWIHKEFAEMTGVEGARVTNIDGPTIEFEAEVNIKIDSPRNIKRIANIRTIDA